MASTSTISVETTDAVAELISGGHGDGPLEAPKNSRKPCRVRSAAIAGGLVAASVSLWNAVSTIHATGRKNRMPTIQATRPRSGAALLRAGPVLVAFFGVDVDGASTTAA